MRSQPTMLHLRRPSTEVVLAGERVPMLCLIERVGGGWGKSRIDALCQWPGAEQWARSLAAGDSLLVELHELHAHGDDMRGVIRTQPTLLPRAAAPAAGAKAAAPHPTTATT